MRTLLLAAILLVCGLGATEAQAIYPEIQSERVVMRLVPGKIARAQSAAHFAKDDTVGFAAYANGRKLYDANAGGSRLDLAGRGAYVVITFARDGTATFKAVALRKMRLVVLMEW